MTFVYPSFFRFLIALVLITQGTTLLANEGEEAQEVLYTEAKDAPRQQSQQEADAKSKGCLTCHTATDKMSMHDNEAVTLGCTDCHGGNPNIMVPHAVAKHRNPEISFTKLNDESPEFIRFVNPSDYRVVRKACGNCHLSEIQVAERSLMSTAAMFWGAAAYNNGILPFKISVLGEYYKTLEGDERKAAEEGGRPLTTGGILQGMTKPDANMVKKGVLPLIAPLPTWEVPIYRILALA